MEDKKLCKRCGETKSLTEFRRYKTPNGTRPTSWCRSCLNEASRLCMREHLKDPEVRERFRKKDRERYQRLKDDPSFRAREKQRSREYTSRPEVKERTSVRSKEWAKANPERAHTNQARWVKENPERARAYWRAYYQTPHGRMRHRLQQCKRRAAIRGNECTLTDGQWDAIHEAWGGRCAYCGGDRRMTVDHVLPIMRGGAHAAHNVLPACLSCNSRKSDRTAEEFLGDRHAEFLRRWQVAMGRVALFTAA